MQLQQRAFVVAAFGVGPLLLAAGCGSAETGSDRTLVPIQPSSYVTIQPATTTTTIPVPTTVVDGRSEAAQTYVVVSGDSVFKIAESFDIDPEVLANFNSWSEGVQHPLFVGDTVEIPPGAAIPGAQIVDSGDGETTDPGDTDTDTEGLGCTHVIVLNENPSKVAEKYGITLEELRAANAGNPAMTSFVVGQSLSIPPNGDC